MVQSILWLLLLINLACLRNSEWIIIAIGALGMFQNGYLAGMQRSTEEQNLPLKPIEIITSKEVMDGLMDFEVSYQGGESLRDEFFPGKLRESEREWWAGRKDSYNAERKISKWHGFPRDPNNANR